MFSGRESATERWGPFAAWRAQHRIAAASSWQRLLSRPGATCLIWLVVAISLALPGALLLTLDSVHRMTMDFDRGVQLSVMLETEATLAEVEAIQGAITAWPEIDRVTFLHRDAALSQFAEQTELSSVLSSLNRNPLPHTLLVAPVMPMPQQTFEGLVGKLADLSKVGRVVANTRWMARLEQVLQAGWRWAWALGIAMVCGAILVLVNTLYLDVDARREEIRVVSLIGGSPAFVRRPFLYSGLYFGAGGGVLATIGLWAFTAWVAGPVNALFLLYDQPNPLLGPGATYPVAMVSLGATGGWLAALFATQRHITQLSAN